MTQSYLRLCLTLAMCASLGPFRLAARPFATTHTTACRGFEQSNTHSRLQWKQFNPLHSINPL